ncbi:MAG: hypothetical protein KAJ07_04770 [Planctomycetes bacterium]|nr:hypothetical protein [Planctomycetota bacterium]
MNYKYTGPKESGVPGLPHKITGKMAAGYKADYDRRHKRMTKAFRALEKEAKGQPVPNLTESRLSGHPAKQLQAALESGVYVEDKKATAPAKAGK